MVAIASGATCCATAHVRTRRSPCSSTRKTPSSCYRSFVGKTLGCRCHPWRRQSKGIVVMLYQAKSRERAPRVTRLVCPKCGSTIDLPGDCRYATQVCVKLGCDGQMSRYRVNRELWSAPRILTANPIVTRPTGHETINGFVPHPVEYKTYEEYLASDLWQHIRGAVYRRDKGKCRICRGGGSQVHHLSYTTPVMEGRQLENLVLLCRPCHQRIEFSKSGRKRSVVEAAKEFRRLSHTTAQKQGKKRRKKHQRRQNKGMFR
jgi:hypothetical protein